MGLEAPGEFHVSAKVIARASPGDPDLRGLSAMLAFGMSGEDQRAHHDLGGVPRFMCEPVDVSPHELTDFDRDVDALRALLSAKHLMSVDELRRGIEAIPEAEYHRLSYYGRWIRSIADNLIAKGVVTEAELQAEVKQP